MASVNKVILLGYLGKDPETRVLDGGKKVTSFSLATTEKYGDKTTTEWHNVTLWNQVAEVAEKYLKKGSKIYLEGKIQYRNYEDKEGNKKYVTDIVGLSLTMLDTKSSGTGDSAAPVAKAENNAENYMNKNRVSEDSKKADATQKSSSSAQVATKEIETTSPVQSNWGNDDLPF